MQGLGGVPVNTPTKNIRDRLEIPMDRFEPIAHWMLRTARNYVITHKAIFRKAIIAYAEILPDPTLGNTYRANTKFWIKERDKFRKYYNNPGREALIEAAWKIWIDEYEHDGHYVDLIDVVVDDIKSEEEWTERVALHPLPRYWTEQRPAPIEEAVRVVKWEG